MHTKDIQKYANNARPPVPDISIVMPVYNGEKFLKDAIESILAQTYINFELIIINDGSSDSSLMIVESYVQQDNRIKVIDQNNTGIVGALNAGIALARGTYIARMDSDDISHPERFERQLQHMREHDASVCGSWATAIDKSGSTLYKMNYPPQSWCAVRWYLVRGNPFIHPSVMIRKDSLTAVGGYRAYQHVEDYELWTRIVPRYRAINIPEYLYLYRIHNDQITKKNTMRMRWIGLWIRLLAAGRLIRS